MVWVYNTSPNRPKCSAMVDWELLNEGKTNLEGVCVEILC